MNSVATESFAELFEQSQTNWAKLKPGAIVKGIVVEVRNDVVVINAGLKSEGIVPIEQFRNDAGEIDVASAMRSRSPSTRSRTALAKPCCRARRPSAPWCGTSWKKALEANATITGRISGKVKGGFTVDIKDVRAFLPGSLVDVRPVRDPVAYLEGKELEFKLIKLDRKRNNVVVSRRAVVESEHSEEREQLLEKLQEGAVLKGVVKNLTDYGAFVDLGGIDGLLHITDMAWKRVRIRPKWSSRRRARRARAQVRPRAQPRVAGPEAAGRGSVGQHRPPLSVQQPRVRQGQQRHRLRRVRRDRAGRRRPGARVRDGLDQQERQPGQGRAGRRRSRSHGAGRGRRASPHLAGHQAGHRQPVGRPSPRSTRRTTRCPARSSRSPTSASSSAWTAASTAWCTCPTSAGTPPAKTSCATTRRATRSKPWCWRSIRSASASAWASSSWRRTRIRWAKGATIDLGMAWKAT
jgi:hypothetical protein